MEPTVNEPVDIDEDLELHDQLVAAVRYLRRHHRPDLTLPVAWQEALGGWLAEQAVLYHQDAPFPPA